MKGPTRVKRFMTELRGGLGEARANFRDYRFGEEARAAFVAKYLSERLGYAVHWDPKRAPGLVKADAQRASIQKVPAGTIDDWHRLGPIMVDPQTRG